MDGLGGMRPAYRCFDAKKFGRSRRGVAASPASRAAVKGRGEGGGGRGRKLGRPRQRPPRQSQLVDRSQSVPGSPGRPGKGGPAKQ